MNGMNGGNMGAAMVGPTPAGHQTELNYIYGMVEDLSRQLADNRRVLEEVVSLVGRIRARARAQNLSNEEIITNAEDLNPENLDVLVSALSDALDKAIHERDANMGLLQQYAGAVGNMVRQAHEHKSRSVSDVSAWHTSYREQLAEAREENSRLREQVWDMQERGGRLNELVRRFRAAYDAEPERYEARVRHAALRQEVRFWKRMAMPDVPDDDPAWSDDDDLIDPAETRRLVELERAAAAAVAADQQMKMQIDEEQARIEQEHHLQQQEHHMQRQQQQQQQEQYQQQQHQQPHEGQQQQQQQQQQQHHQQDQAGSAAELKEGGNLAESLNANGQQQHGGGGLQSQEQSSEGGVAMQREDSIH